jgi:UDP-glucuronate 4-epimerase
MLFTKAILEGKPIDVFNEGRMSRDFTYIDDIVTGVLRVAARPARPAPNYNPEHPDPGSSHAPYRVYNIGNNQPVALMTFIETLERAIGREAIKNMKPMQPGDVPATYADIDDLERDFGYRPKTELSAGVKAFVDWYRDFYKV